MRTSLVIPPARPTTAASTTTPNRSSFARTAASPPLRPKTNVPARLRTRMSVGLKPTGTSIGDERSRRPAPGREERDPPGGPSRPPGWSRRPAPGGRPRFAYLDDSGRPVTDAEALARIAALALPPAWTDVWISPDPGAKVQAVGVDAAGRTQYRYSAAWTALRAREKFAHVPDFARALPLLRTEVARRLGAGPDGGSDETPPLDRERVLAAAVRLLDLGFFRVGS